jgi:hypothetical protein
MQENRVYNTNYDALKITAIINQYGKKARACCTTVLNENGELTMDLKDA